LEKSLPADKNLSKRVYSAFVFVPVLILITYVGGVVFTLLVTVLVLLGMYELFGILEAGGAKPARLFGYILAASVCFFAFYSAGRPGMIVAGFTVTVLAAVLLFGVESLRGRKSINSALTLGCVLYVAWLFSMQIPLRESGAILIPEGPFGSDVTGWLLLLFGYSMVWTCDTGAYFVGKKFGRHKLIPSVSPGKTVEGAVGGFLLTILVAFLFRYLFLKQLTTGTTALLGVTAGVTCQIGDIFESKLKRMGNIKDSSNIIPGHGGILDRFDGMVFALPALYYALLAGAGRIGIH